MIVHPFPRISRYLLCACLILLPLSLVACAADTGAKPMGCGVSGVPCLSGTALVSLQTSKGEIRIRLDGKDAPLTAGNFVDLVNRGTYDGTVFHRVVRDPVPFVVQGGDPQSADPKIPASQYGTGSFVDPATGEARLIPLEIVFKKDNQPHYGAPKIGRAHV